MKTMIGAVLCVCSTLIVYSLPAFGDSGVIARSLTVDASGLDLTRPRDLQQLERRIERAAQRVCGPEPFLVTPDPVGYLGYETCYRRALKSARAKVDELVREARSRPERLAKP